MTSKCHHKSVKTALAGQLHMHNHKERAFNLQVSIVIDPCVTWPTLVSITDGLITSNLLKIFAVVAKLWVAFPANTLDLNHLPI